MLFLFKVFLNKITYKTLYFKHILILSSIISVSGIVFQYYKLIVATLLMYKIFLVLHLIHHIYIYNTSKNINYNYYPTLEPTLQLRKKARSYKVTNITSISSAGITKKQDNMTNTLFKEKLS